MPPHRVQRPLRPACASLLVGYLSCNATPLPSASLNISHHSAPTHLPFYVAVKRFIATNIYYLIPNTGMPSLARRLEPRGKTTGSSDYYSRMSFGRRARPCGSFRLPRQREPEGEFVKRQKKVTNFFFRGSMTEDLRLACFAGHGPGWVKHSQSHATAAGQRHWRAALAKLPRRSKWPT